MVRRPDAAERAGYERRAFEAAGIRHVVYRGGDGPAVLLLHEMPSLSWRTIAIADLIRGRGYRVVMPRFGRAVIGRTTGVEGAADAVRGAANAIGMCVSSQFVVLAQGRTSPIAGWLQALARHEQTASARSRVGVRPVGVVGMCFTGGFALATALDPSIGLAVASQPSLPFAAGPLRRIPGQAADPGISAADLDRLADRTSRGDLCVRAYRYSNDPLAPAERIELLVERLGCGIRYVPIDLGPDDPPSHPVLSDAATVDGDGATPARKARKALDDLLAALDECLNRPPSGAAG
ncbi:MAG: dienelactone hydrolase [Chloroflexota bacterium]